MQDRGAFTCQPRRVAIVGRGRGLHAAPCLSGPQTTWLAAGAPMRRQFTHSVASRPDADHVTDIVNRGYSSIWVIHETRRQ